MFESPNAFNMAKVVKLPKTKIRPKYKYGINHQLTLLPRTVKVDDVVDHLEKDGITRSEFYWDRSIAFGSDKSISSDRLLIYCKVFDCTISDLINHEVKATSIREKYLAGPARTKLKSSLR
jgi:hypothetical protein